MDEHNDDPYEQQLYAVFQSCLIKGETELHEDKWLSLCHKLHLTEQSEELKSCIQQHKQEKQSISFQEFRTALLTLLDKTQESVIHTDKDNITELQSDINSHIIDNKRCDPLTSNNSSSNIDFLNAKAGVTVDENRLKCLWEKINICLKENVDSATMYFISNCLGIPALPKQITQCIFEKLDQNCDGLISLDEFLVIFQNKTMEDQLTLDKNTESTKELSKLDFRKCNFDIHTPHKTSITNSNTFRDTWKLSNITNTSLLTDGGLKTSEMSLTDLTTTLCDELKNFNDSLDHSAIRSHVMLLRDVLILYQEELHSLNLAVENVNGEKEKLRTDIMEANERANTLAQEIDEQHTRQEEIVQNLRKQIEQRHAEIIQDLSNQLNSEREMNVKALKSKDDQIQMLQKENYEVRNKFVNTLQENQVLETENENLCSQIEKHKQSNNELLTQIKILAAEHDEMQNVEVKHQQEVMYLVDRIKNLQSEAVLLRDQNDELTAEIGNLKLHNCHNKDLSYCRQSNLPDTHTTRNIQSDEIENKEAFVVEEDDIDVVLKHSTPLSCNSHEEDNMQNYKKTDLKHFKDTIIKQLKYVLINSNKCTLENCMFKDEILEIIMKLQSNSNTQVVKATDFVKSIAFEMETECEERASESLRDFVVPKHKNSVSTKRTMTSSSNDNNCDFDNYNGQDIKSLSQNKVSSLRDYPPRKEEHMNIDHLKLNKEKDTSVINCAKVLNEINAKTNSSLTKSESSEDDVFLKLKLKELEAAHAAERKQLTERCAELERSLDLLKIEYEECEDYWTAKLEEERQLFEQEQKISDEKFSELIAKMAEYEELISPIDKVKNSGRLSPIEEKFNLEQQYLDLEEEFEKWKAQMEEEISQKDTEIKDLREKIKSLERPITADISVQVTDDFIFSSLLARSNYVPNDSFNIQPSSESVSKLAPYNDNIHKVPEEFKFNRILESSNVSNDFTPRLTKDHTDSSNCDPHQIHAQHFHNLEYDLVQNTFKLKNLKSPNCQCVRNDAQLCCINVNILQNLSMKLQAQGRKNHQLQECFKQQQYHTERVLQHVMSQHQVEMSELQCLLRSTQERLQIEFQTSAEQAEQLARTDILVKDLYIENAYLIANLKRLQHYHTLTGLHAESTSI
ncbi:PREDICTED: blastoderm-specific protein 25D [Habropoda laboriosa]|uniref:blastoderm-specific protein 25D n=1 Tax=Habropoda laboriosa TaxID=597456 RepID=UPI00083CE62C|nr:PREDICTED: blastoderm-specific protein 25D [Habropoda laboriosa]